MTRLFFSITFLAVLISLAPAAPVPTHLRPKPDPLAFPAKVGTRWVFQSQNGQPDLILTVTSVAVGEKSTAVRVGQVLDDGTVVPWQTLAVSPAGWFLTRVQDQVVDPPVCLLQLPPVPDRVWEMKWKEGSLVARGWETVKVPAGTFRAIRVETSCDGVDRRFTSYYALGVGEVQMAVRNGDTQVLKSFAPGKD